jgi:hypothetical protein
MSTIKKITKTEIERASIISAELRSNLNKASICIEDDAITDLRDIYEICSIYIKLMDELVLDTTSVEDIVEIFKHINNDLYIHLSYHCKNLKKPLQKVLDSLDKTKS